MYTYTSLVDRGMHSDVHMRQKTPKWQLDIYSRGQRNTADLYERQDKLMIWFIRLSKL